MKFEVGDEVKILWLPHDPYSKKGFIIFIDQDRYGKGSHGYKVKIKGTGELFYGKEDLRLERRKPNYFK